MKDLHFFTYSKTFQPFIYKLCYIYPQERGVYVVCMRVSSMLEAAAASLWSGRVEAAQCPASASHSEGAHPTLASQPSIKHPPMHFH